MLTTGIGGIMGSSFPGTGICFIFTDSGVPQYYTIAIVALIALFGMKEMLVVSNMKDRSSMDCLDMGIYPLMICFIAAFFAIGLSIIFSELYSS